MPIDLSSIEQLSDNSEDELIELIAQCKLGDTRGVSRPTWPSSVRIVFDE